MRCKQYAAALLTGAMLLCAIGCSGRSNDKTSSGESNTGDVRLGVSLTALRRVEPQQSKLEGLAAAVLIDREGKILSCVLDEWELTPQIENGSLNTITDLRTKAEKKDDYGLEAAGSSYEWYEQVDAFCAYLKGMTANDLAAIPLNDGKAADADLVSKCSIEISGFITAVEQAIRNAVLCNAAGEDDLGLGITLLQSSSDGTVAISAEVAAIACDAQGKATAAFVDEVSMDVNVKDGVFTDKDGSFASKKQQGTAYGMKGQSAIGKEWFEQAHALETALLGKTAADIRSLPLKDGRPANADLAATCTITVDSILANAVKAANNAQ